MSTPSDWQSVRRIGGLLEPHRLAVWSALILMGLSSAGLLGLPVLVRGMLEGAAREQPPSAWQVGLMAAVLTVLAVCAYLSAVLLNVVARKVCAHLRSEYAQRWLRSSMSAHRRIPAGEYAERLNTSLADVDWFIRGSLANALALLVLMTGGIVMLFWISWKLALVIVLIGPLVVAALRAIERHGRTWLRKGRGEAEKMAGLLQSMVLGLDVIKSFNAEDEALKRFGARQSVLLETQKKESVVTSLVDPLLIFAGAATFLLVVFFAGQLVAAGSLDLPQFITFLVYLMFVLPNLRNVGIQIARWRHVKTALDFLDDSSHMPAEPDNGKVRLSADRGRIECRNIVYRHHEREAGLEGFTCTIEPGEHVGIVGESGAGKSTLLSLLLRFYEPQRGQLFIDGQDIGDCALASVRGAIAYVPQETILFDGTIRDNLRLAQPSATDQEIREACLAAQVWSFIESLPAGLDTEAGDRGLRLSAGQRQRLAIARALLKKAPILLLDEATSALDPKTEKLFASALHREVAGRTMLVVAHRLAAVADLPRIIFINHGVIAAEGTHRELLAGCADYRLLAGADS
ncbi:MAG: ABC transporter ATP-binding protein [Chthoniobacterales bacterium]